MFETVTVPAGLEKVNGLCSCWLVSAYSVTSRKRGDAYFEAETPIGETSFPYGAGALLKQATFTPYLRLWRMVLGPKKSRVPERMDELN